MKFKLIIFVCSFLSIFNINCMTEEVRKAAVCGDIQTVLRFFNEGKEKDVNVIIDSINQTLLHYAAYYGMKDIAEMLILRGADVNVVAEGNWTPLHSAATGNNPDIIELLLRYKANPNALTDDPGSFYHLSSPLHLLLIKNRPSIDTVKLLLEHEADPRLRDYFRNKPADYAKDQAIKDLLNAKEQELNKRVAPDKGDEKGQESKTISEQLFSNLQIMKTKIGTFKFPLKIGMMQFIDEIKQFIEQKIPHKTDLISRIDKLVNPVYNLINETDLNNKKAFEKFYFETWIPFTKEYQKIAK